MQSRPHLLRPIEEWPASTKFPGDKVRREPVILLIKPDGSCKTMAQIQDEVIARVVDFCKGDPIQAHKILGLL